MHAFFMYIYTSNLSSTNNDSSITYPYFPGFSQISVIMFSYATEEECWCFIYFVFQFVISMYVIIVKFSKLVQRFRLCLCMFYICILYILPVQLSLFLKVNNETIGIIDKILFSINLFAIDFQIGTFNGNKFYLFWIYEKHLFFKRCTKLFISINLQNQLHY